MLKCKRKGRDVYLIPELCRLVGLTEQMKDDFKLMREYNSSVKTDAPVKVKECLQLLNTFLKEHQYLKESAL